MYLRAGICLWLISLSMIIVLASSAGAWAAPLSPAVKDQCGAEIRSKCLRPWRLTPDAITMCVEKNKTTLSPTCQAFWVTAHMCQLEMKTVCNGLNPLTIKSCLRNLRQQFSPLCQETLDIE
jgi:hypothetical protein